MVTLLHTKLHYPHPSSRILSRDILTDKIEQALMVDQRRLILLSAQAGTGKTTLL